ncbi:MAG: hypothetical protein WCT77_05740, partial [Bacteroidota bacterium]
PDTDNLVAFGKYSEIYTSHPREIPYIASVGGIEYYFRLLKYLKSHLSLEQLKEKKETIEWMEKITRSSPIYKYLNSPEFQMT